MTVTMRFTCPNCGLPISDEKAQALGERRCERCGEPIGRRQNGASLPPFRLDITPSRPAKKDFSLSSVLIMVAVIAVIVWMLSNAVGPRESPRAPCVNNQKQITLALFGYEAEKGYFPPAFVADKNGKPMHSWRVLLLPYLDRRDLYEQYDFSEPWNGPHNRLLADKMPPVFACPANRDAPNCTSYAMLVGPHAFSPGPRGRTLDEISTVDGTSNTLMLVEAAEAKINWLEPRDLNVDEMSFQLNKSGKELSSHHGGGMVVVSFCDGHTSTLSPHIEPETLKALTTVDGREPIKEGSY
jgi:prepilin-type processing-associated H-X9-DG protein